MRRAFWRRRSAACTSSSGASSKRRRRRGAAWPIWRRRSRIRRRAPRIPRCFSDWLARTAGRTRAPPPPPSMALCRLRPICMAMRGMWPAASRCSRLFRGLTARVAVAVAVLLICGLLAATLVRMAPGFGMDERMLDMRLSGGSLRAMERQGAEQSDILHYYWPYLGQLSRGELGKSRSSGRPVRDLLSERLALSLGSAAAGLGLAWMRVLGTVTILELSQRRIGEGLASLAAGALLCTPAALVALACVYIGATPTVAIAAIVFPRIFRYLRDVVRQAGAAPHVLTAHALGLPPWRILACHVAPPVQIGR